jgi:2-phosphosulfolactate phosphatase
MQIRVCLLPDADRVGPDTDVAIVIDVLRATSVIVTALAGGAREFLVCREIAEAVSLADRRDPRPLLCGERKCRPIDGFDLGNSPAEYSAERVAGKSLILTTTNGTAAIKSAARAQRLITASFLNLSAAIDSIRNADRVVLVCAGTDGSITAEDALLAGALVCACQTRYRAALRGDEATLAKQLWASWFDPEAVPTQIALSGRLRATDGGRNLVAAGYADDLDRCAAIDTLDRVPTRVATDPTTLALESS